MGTIKSSETLSEAEYLRSQREKTQAEVDALNVDHGALIRYRTADRHAPSAH
jgi:hypothetical protein